MMIAVVAALSLSTREMPCPQSIAEGHAFYQLFSADPIWPLTTETERPVFTGGNTYAPAYAFAFETISLLADKMASTNDCSLEQQGCFTHLLQAHEELRGVISVEESEATLTDLWEKTRRSAMVNFLRTVDACDARFVDLMVNGGVSRGKLEYKPPV